MIIHVFDGDQSRQASSTELPTEFNFELVLITVGSARNLLELDASVRSIDPSKRRSANRFIFRMPAHGVTDPSVFTSADDLPMLTGRLEGIPFSFLCRDNDGNPHFQFHSDAVTSLPNEEQLLDGLRVAELRSLLKQPGVELPAVPDFHYRGPNGRHFDRFLRVGFAMTQTPAVDAFLFWTEPCIKEATTLLVDTGGILTLGYAAKAAKPDLSVYNLSGYSDSLPRLRVDTGANATLLISVSSSGALASRLKQLWADQYGGRLRVISLYGYQGFEPANDDTLLCPLEIELTHHASEECPSCRGEKRSTLLPIDPHTYLLEIGGATTPCKIRATDAKEAKEFFTRYSGAGVIQLHRNDDSGRHHMVYVDIQPLLTIQTFRDRLNETTARIKQRRQIEHVICPSHPNAVALATLVTAAIGLPEASLVISDERDTGRLKDLALRRAKGAQCLIVDDVLVSGHRIRGYKNALHSCGFDFGSNELSFLVAVDRSPSKDDRTKVKDMLDRGESFFPVEQLILPNWDAKKCPWCQELRAIEKTMHAFPEDEQMRSRFHHLDQPISQNPFLPGLGGAPDSLGQTSIFSPQSANAVEIFASVASALQNLRSLRELNSHRDIPVARILQNEFTFKGRYYDTIVTASILRATRDFDLRTFQIDPTLHEEFRERLNEAGGAELYGEILFACAQGNLPTPENAAIACDKVSTTARGLGQFLRMHNHI